MGHEELQMCVCLQSYNVTGITEIWWDDAHDWSVGLDGYKLFRKHKQRRRGGSVALYIQDKLESMELHLRIKEEEAERLQVRIKPKPRESDIIVVVCYRPPSQED